jgi:hypothetical protein
MGAAFLSDCNNQVGGGVEAEADYAIDSAASEVI